MSVNEIVGAVGEWNISLHPDTPQDILDALDYWGHIAITAAPVEASRYGDNLLNTARYVGVLRKRELAQDDKTIGGGGMALWLGDEDDKGQVYETKINFTAQSFGAVITALLPSAILAGTMTPLSGLYTGSHLYESPRTAIDYVTGLYDAEWRINSNGRLDAGKATDLYPTDPTCAIVRQVSEGGIDMALRALPGDARLEADMEDFTTRVFLVGGGAVEGAPIFTAFANIQTGLNPYLDLHGTPLKRTRLISSQTTIENAQATAQLQLNRFTSPREAIKLSTITHDIKGDLICGGYVWVEDKSALLYDPSVEVRFKGLRLNPVKLRVRELSWPVERGMGVAYRHWNGTWYDLSKYVVYEEGQTSITVGDFNRSLTGSTGFQQPAPPGGEPPPDTTIPAAPTWVLPFQQGVYQSQVDGSSIVQVQLTWNQPLNTNGTVITDGGRYEVRYRTTDQAVYFPTNDEMELYTNANLTGGTFTNPIPFPIGAWNFINIPWGELQYLQTELTPGTPYEFQIRAIDNSSLPNVGAWSVPAVVQTRPDRTAPSAPGPPSIAASRISVQVTSDLNAAGSAGTFNLEADLHHFNVYMANEPTFSADPAFLIGDMPATVSQLRAQTKVIKTFQVESTDAMWYKITAVDHFGNESLPSVAVQQTALLIDNAHISNLTVSKLMAGTISVAVIQGGDFTTATTGVRAGFNFAGFYAFNAANVKTFDVSAATGIVNIVGKITAQDRIQPNDKIVLDPEYIQAGGGNFPTLLFYSNGGLFGPARINGTTIAGGATRLGINSGASANTANFLQTTLLMTPTAAALQYNNEANDLRGGRLYAGDTQANVDVWTTAGVLAAQLSVRRGANSFFTRYDGTLDNGMELQADRVAFHVDGGFVFNIRNPPASLNSFVEAGRYAGFGESQFKGQVLSMSGTFAVGNDGGPDPILYVDTKAARYVKNFVIDHPVDPERWLVHATTESPVPGVEYSGTVVVKNYMAYVELPSYFEELTHADGRQVWVQPMLPDSGFHPFMPRAIPSFPKDGKFRISTDARDGTIISWRVFARRKDVTFPVEPLKSEYKRSGIAPYTYIEES